MSLAKMVLFQHRIEVFQLDEEVVVVEFTVPSSWVGKSLQDLAVREEYHLNIIGYRDAEDQPLHIQIAPDFIWPEGVRVMAVTDNQYLDRIQDLLEETKLGKRPKGRFLGFIKFPKYYWKQQKN